MANSNQVNVDRFTHPKLVYDPLRHRPAKPAEKLKLEPEIERSQSTLERFTDEQLVRMLDGKS